MGIRTHPDMWYEDTVSAVFRSGFVQSAVWTKHFVSEPRIPQGSFDILVHADIFTCCKSLTVPHPSCGVTDWEPVSEVHYVHVHGTSFWCSRNQDSSEQTFHSSSPVRLSRCLAWALISAPRWHERNLILIHWDCSVVQVWLSCSMSCSEMLFGYKVYLFTQAWNNCFSHEVTRNLMPLDFYELF